MFFSSIFVYFTTTPELINDGIGFVCRTQSSIDICWLGSMSVPKPLNCLHWHKKIDNRLIDIVIVQCVCGMSSVWHGIWYYHRSDGDVAFPFTFAVDCECLCVCNVYVYDHRFSSSSLCTRTEEGWRSEFELALGAVRMIACMPHHCCCCCWWLWLLIAGMMLGLGCWIKYRLAAICM